ncbi:hypothetical protein B0H13DRAFT_2276959 [Mycena leptocephala]|nr:hypothetical protein B0H13DRAFT_2276959 [Mycena leptocephala]
MRRTPMYKRTILTQRPAELRHERNSHHPLWPQVSEPSVDLWKRVDRRRRSREPMHDARCAIRDVHRRAAYVCTRTSEAADDQSPGARMYGPHVRRPADCTSYSSSGGGAEYHITGPPVPCADTMYDALWPPARHVTRGSPPQRASNRISPPAPSPSPYKIASRSGGGGIASNGERGKGKDEEKMGTQARVTDGSIEKDDEGRWTGTAKSPLGCGIGDIRYTRQKKKAVMRPEFGGTWRGARYGSSTGRGGGDRSKKSPDGPQPAVEIAAPISQMSGEREGSPVEKGRSAPGAGGVRIEVQVGEQDVAIRRVDDSVGVNGLGVYPARSCSGATRTLYWLARRFARRSLHTDAQLPTSAPPRHRPYEGSGTSGRGTPALASCHFSRAKERTSGRILQGACLAQYTSWRHCASSWMGVRLEVEGKIEEEALQPRARALPVEIGAHRLAETATHWVILVCLQRLVSLWAGVHLFGLSSAICQAKYSSVWNSESFAIHRGSLLTGTWWQSKHSFSVGRTSTRGSSLTKLCNAIKLVGGWIPGAHIDGRSP